MGRQAGHTDLSPVLITCDVTFNYGFKLCLRRTHLRYIVNLRIYVSVLVHNIGPRETAHCDKSATKQIGTSSIRPRKITRSTEPLCDAELLVIRDVQ